MSFHRSLLPEPCSFIEEQGLELSGPSSAKWKTAACVFHGGSDSMRINTSNGAWVCMSFNVKGGDVLLYQMKVHGMDCVQAGQAVGAWTEDGEAPDEPQNPAPLPALAALSMLSFEALLTAVAAGNIAQGIELTPVDRARLMLAARRINQIAEAYT